MQEDGSLSVEEKNLPNIEIGAILVKTLYSEVCGTDVHLSHNQLAGVPYPIIPGHVSVGVIDQLAGEIKDVDGKLLAVGDTITFLDVHETCNSCWYCLVAKETTRCPSRKVYGITYSANEGLLGGWSQYIYLKPGVKVIKFEDGFDPLFFMAGGCGLPTAIHAVERANIKLGDSVAIQGAGPVGLMAAILSKIRGAFEVILIGAPRLRLEIAKEFGIDFIIDINEYDAQERVTKVIQYTSNRGVDCTIEATGVPSAIREGLQMTRDGGTYVVVGQYTDAGEVNINPHIEINKKHITVKGSWGSDFSHFHTAVKFVQKFQNQYPWRKIISQIYDLDDVNTALNDVKDLKVMKAIIKPN